MRLYYQTMGAVFARVDINVFAPEAVEGAMVRLPRSRIIDIDLGAGDVRTSRRRGCPSSSVDSIGFLQLEGENITCILGSGEVFFDTTTLREVVLYARELALRYTLNSTHSTCEPFMEIGIYGGYNEEGVAREVSRAIDRVVSNMLCSSTVILEYVSRHGAVKIYISPLSNRMTSIDVEAEKTLLGRITVRALRGYSTSINIYTERSYENLKRLATEFTEVARDIEVFIIARQLAETDR